MALSNKSQQVQDYLKKDGYTFEVIELQASTRTAREAADAVGCTIGQIVKSLVFRSGNEPILFLVSGKNQMDIQKVSKKLGFEIKLADADFTKEMTGYAIGGVPPAAHISPIVTYVDEDLFKYDEVWAAAGTPHSVFKLKSSDLLPLTKGKEISVN